MNAISRSALLVAIMSVVPVAATLAQNNNPENTGGTSGSKIANPTYPAGGANPALTDRPSAGAANVPAAANPTVPGATGSTVVPGSNSTIASDRPGTIEKKTGSGSSSGGSGGAN